jgi:hypothetical protein
MAEGKKMDKIIQFKQFNLEKIKKKYELEGCDDELVELAEKLAQCNPAGRSGKKKEAIRAEHLRKAADYRPRSMRHRKRHIVMSCPMRNLTLPQEAAAS